MKRFDEKIAEHKDIIDYAVFRLYEAENPMEEVEEMLREVDRTLCYIVNGEAILKALSHKKEEEK